MFERTGAKSAGWRIFAVLTFTFAFPILAEGLRFDVGWPMFKSVVGLIGLIGLFTYAYGVRIGPRLFWAGFAVFFSAGLMVKLGQQIGAAWSLPPGVPVPGSHSPAVMGLGLAISLLVCLALFRQSGMFGAKDDEEEPRPRRLRREIVAYGKIFE
jgi:hypothetical protein